MGVEARIPAESLRKARDAETAHLEALLKVNGAKYLRLAHLRDLLPASMAIELKATPGDDPQLWLDLSHRISMEPDAKTYRLNVIAPHHIDTLLQTESVDEVRLAAENVIAHSAVTSEWAKAGAAKAAADVHGWRYATLVYVWLTGIVTGGAVLALYLIYMKNMTF